MEKLTQMPAQKEEVSEISKEAIFETIVINDIISAFINDLEDAEADEDTVKEFTEELSNLSEVDIKGVLSMPKELRMRNFPQFVKDIEDGKTTPQTIIQKLAEQARTYGYTLGYHATNSKIIPQDSTWTINGTEVDDRDDRAMAYYSETYEDIFRADRRKFLYIVRSIIGENTDHRRDTSNNWGRAATLSIVDEIDLQKTDELVEEIYNKEIKNTKQKDAA